MSPVGGDSGPNRHFAPTVYRDSGTEQRDRTTTGGGLRAGRRIGRQSPDSLGARNDRTALRSEAAPA